LLALGLPYIICAVVLMILPESPKFVYSKGNEKRAIQILENIYRVNNGSETKLNITKILKDPDHEDDDECTNKSTNPFKFMLYQIVQLTSKKYIWKTFIALLIQFSIFGSNIGLYVFFPELIDPLIHFNRENPGKGETLCQVYETHRRNITSFEKIEDQVSLPRIEKNY
jgi:hypothetical protein